MPCLLWSFKLLRSIFFATVTLKPSFPWLIGGVPLPKAFSVVLFLVLLALLENIKTLPHVDRIDILIIPL